MTKGTTPVVMCDAEDVCATWVVDYYTMGATTVNGVPCTPVPQGWTLTADGDHLCPEHSAATGVGL